MAFKTLLFVLTLLILCFRQVLPFKFQKPRILNGEDAQIGQFPWHVGLASMDSDLTVINLCSGAIISENWILTTAYCINGAGLVGFRSGAIYSYDEPDGVMGGSPVYTIHEEFDNATLRNDIGLVYVDPPLTLNENISSIALTDKELEVGVDATITGWGHSSHDDEANHTYTLEYTNVKTIANSVCQSIYGSEIVVPSVVCTIAGDSGATPCFGDDGGPLVVNATSDPVLVAIFSFTSSLGCENYPAGYTRIGYYRGWIREKTGI